jgi:hypothetical protein
MGKWLLAPHPDQRRPRPRGCLMDGSQATTVELSAASLARLDPRLREISWPSGRLTEALEALASRAGLLNGAHAARTDVRLPPVPEIEAIAQAGQWIEWIAEHRGIEAEPLEFPLPGFMNDPRGPGWRGVAVPRAAQGSGPSRRADRTRPAPS